MTSRARRIRPRPMEPADTPVVSKMLKVVGTVVAPATVLTGLLLYFGRLHANGLAEYFGLQYSVLDLTPHDYLVRSADGLILPAVIAACVALIALWAHQIVTRVLPPQVRRRTLTVVIPVVAVLGIGLITVALLDAFGGPSLFGPFGEGRGLCLAIGAPLLAYAVRLVRFYPYTNRGLPLRPVAEGMLLAEWTAVFALLSVGLFWAAGTYAAGVGTGRAQQLEAMLPEMADVTVFSDKDLNLDGQPGVYMLHCSRADAGYGFRYSGLRLILQSGNQYLLLPSGWSQEEGAAVLLPRRDGLRLEFSWNSNWRPSSC